MSILEKLRRNNIVIEEALHERLQLVADILKIPLSNSNNTSDSQNKNALDEPNEILLSAVSQGIIHHLYFKFLLHFFLFSKKEMISSQY